MPPCMLTASALPQFQMSEAHTPQRPCLLRWHLAGMLQGLSRNFPVIPFGRKLPPVWEGGMYMVSRPCASAALNQVKYGESLHSQGC